MNGYLKVCGIILNIVVVYLAIAYTISGIVTRKLKKKKAAEKARVEAAYKEELKLAEKAWQKWVKKFDKFQQLLSSNTTKLSDRPRLHLELVQLYRESYFFSSINRKQYLDTLGQENNWVLPENPPQPTEVLNG